MGCPQDWDLSPAQARALQIELAGKVRIEKLPEHFAVLGASDIGYVKAGNRQVAVMVTFDWPSLELLETAHCITEVRFPYIPGLLSFREIPPLLEAHRRLKRPPDVLLCDGQGIAHPRRLGLASHLGLCLDIPTVGCAKKRLCGAHDPLDSARGSWKPLLLHDETVGCVYRSREAVKPIYISPGHLSDFDTARTLIERCLRRYRLPEPLRMAHHTATRLRREVEEY